MTSASASPLLRWYFDGPSLAAPSALMWTSRRTPADLQAAMMERGSSTCALRERRPALLVQDADEVHDGVGAVHQRGELARIADVGLHDPHRRQQHDVARPLAAPRGDDDPVAVVDQLGNDVPADEPGPPEDDDRASHEVSGNA